MAIILKNAPKTEEGRRLNLTKEQEEECRIVFRFDKETKKLASIEPWSVEGKYDNYCVIGPLSSTYAGRQSVDSIHPIRNVRDTTDDPNPYGDNWLGVIKLVYDIWGNNYNFKNCCLDAYHYDNRSGKEIPTYLEKHNQTGIVGGHMIWRDEPSPYYKDLQYFYLLPICKTHNYKGQDPFYFKELWPIDAVKMKNPLYALNIQSALLSLAESTEGDGDIEFDVKKYCEKNGVEVKDMFFD